MPMPTARRRKPGVTVRWTTITARIMAAAVALALMGGGVAFAGTDDGADTTQDETPIEVTDSTKPTLPEDLAEALDAYRAAIRDWRHCLIDMVTGVPRPTRAGARLRPTISG